jgi:gentisate 1,2-dioxygenase
VPNWARHHHVNLSKTGEAILFSVHDTPVLKALGLYREDEVSG